MRYKKASWKDVIDPAFDSIIKLYLWSLGKTHLPSNEGFLSLELDENEQKKMASAHFPGVAFLYEKNKVDVDILGDIGTVMGFEVKKADFNLMREMGKSLSGLYTVYSSAAELLEDKSKKYYSNAFDFLSSEEKYKRYFSDADETQKAKIRKKYQSDVLSLMVHCLKIGLDELKEKAKTDEMRRILRNKISGRSSALRRVTFFIWDSISLLVHKKSLKQLYTEAKQGSDEALFKLMQIDKTLFDDEWFRTRIRKAVYMGEWEFFISLGDAIRRDPLANRRIHGDALLVLLMFWKAGLYRLTVPQLMELLKDSGLRMKYDEVNFRAFISVQIKPIFKDW
jgi:hypothetical protein